MTGRKPTDQSAFVDVTADEVAEWFRSGKNKAGAVLPDRDACARLAMDISNISRPPRHIDGRLRPIAQAIATILEQAPAARSHWLAQPNSVFELNQIQALETVLGYFSPHLLLEKTVVDIEVGQHVALRFLFPHVMREWKAAGLTWSGKPQDASPVCIFLSRAMNWIGYGMTPGAVRQALEEDFRSGRLQPHQTSDMPSMLNPASSLSKAPLRLA